MDKEAEKARKKAEKEAKFAAKKAAAAAKANTGAAAKKDKKEMSHKYHGAKNFDRLRKHLADLKLPQI